jgi:ubiquinone/menaquinone biosynthesis C-methylase UbiE
MKVEEAFDVLAELGDSPEEYERELERNDPLYEELIRRAEIQPGSRVLELGCGTGPVTVKLAQGLGHSGRVCGIDVSRRMLRFAREKKERLGLGTLDLRLMSMEKLDFPDGSFDHIVSSFGVCCCFHYKLALSEARRVLVPQGRLTFSQGGPNGTDKGRLVEEIYSRYEPRNPTPKLRKKMEANSVQQRLTRRYQYPSVVIALMRSVGFRDVKCTIRRQRTVFPTIDEYLDSYFFSSLGYAQLGKARREELKRKCFDALKSYFAPARGLSVNFDVQYFSGRK